MKVIRRHEGKTVKVLGDQVNIKVESADSPYSMAIVVVDVPPGSGTAFAASMATYSAAVPKARRSCASNSQTRWPTRSPGTPGPAASTTPAPS